MACCFGGGSRRPTEALTAPSVPAPKLGKAAKPELMLKQAIPLSLGQGVKFRLTPAHKWEVEQQEGVRTQKRDLVSEKMQAKVQEESRELEQRLNQLRRESVGQIEREKQLDEQIIKNTAYIRGIECLIAKEKIEIYKFQDKIAGK